MRLLTVISLVIATSTTCVFSLSVEVELAARRGGFNPHFVQQHIGDEFVEDELEDFDTVFNSMGFFPFTKTEIPKDEAPSFANAGNTCYIG